MGASGSAHCSIPLNEPYAGFKPHEHFIGLSKISFSLLNFPLPALMFAI